MDLLERVSLPNAWAENWREWPSDAVMRDVDGTWFDGFDMLDRTARVAARLHGAGLRPGDRVLLSGRTSAEFVFAHCGALRLGLVVVPVDASFSRRELDVVLAAASARAAIIEGAQMRSWLPDELLVTGLDVDLPNGIVPALDAVAPDDPALIVFTSGTTGTPKGAVLSHGNLLASAQAVRIAWHWEASDTLILCLPLFHMHGLGVGVHGTLLTGAAMVLQRGFDPETVLATCDDATMFFGVPTMYARLVDAPGIERLKTLRLCVSGSAPLSSGLHRQIQQLTGQSVLERYGMTETVMLVSNPYEGERRPGSVGLPLSGVELRLEPTTMEIQARGPNVFSGYLDPAANTDAFTADGWFRTGDIGALDGDGYVRIIGRSKELIITGGYNVYPREIEDVLRAHPDVRDAAVLGRPSKDWGEIVTAFIEADASVDIDAVLAYAADELAPYKRPRAVHRVDALPRNSLGKVQRDRLQP